MSRALFFPNSFGRHYLNAVEEIIGKSGCDALLHMAKLSHMVAEAPPDNLERDFNAAAYAGINVAFRQMAGKRLGSGIANRTGRASFYHLLKNTDFISIERAKIQQLTGSAQLATLLPLLVQPMTLFSEEAIVDIADHDGIFLMTLRVCPACWGITSEATGDDPGKPICDGIVGWLSEGILWATGQEIAVEERACHATREGDHCVFSVGQDP